jgi:hypothetical protein
LYPASQLGSIVSIAAVAHDRTMDALSQKGIVSMRYPSSSGAYPDVQLAGDGEEVDDICDEPVPTPNIT